MIYHNRHSGTIFSSNTDWLHDPKYLVPKPVSRSWRIFAILAGLAVLVGIVAAIGWG